jgi:hypothetical protein
LVCAAAARAAGGAGVNRPAGSVAEANAALAFSGPYTHKNLTIYLVHGSDRLKAKDFLTLQEALDRKKAVVAETGDVNQLTVESLCDVPIYIHAGAIIKGGKQDRMIKDDYVIPPRNKVTIHVFCVEQGRWRARGAEPVTGFSGNSAMVSSKELKLAARDSKEQGRVWSEVAKSQDKLSANVGGEVRAQASESSLQLTLEDKKVQAAAEEYRKALADVGKDQKDVIGYAFAINGKINSVDVYGARALFERLWPQLLDSTAVEAVAAYEKDKKYPVPDKAAVAAFLEESRKARTEEEAVSKDSTLLKRVTGRSANFTTVDKSSPAAATVRENVINKE